MMFGEPFVPYRGRVAFQVDYIILKYFAVPVVIILIFWVIDVSRRCADLIQKLSHESTDWCENVKKRYEKKLNVPPAYLGEFINIDAVARLTRAIHQCVYYPIIIVLLMGFARLKMFDNWDLPYGLLFVILISLSLSILCVIMLRSSAKEIREVALNNLFEKLVFARGESGAAEVVCRQIEMVIDQVRSIKKGAFVPVIEQPWVRATALFFTGSGSLIALQYFK